MEGDQHAVPGNLEIRLNEVRTLLDSELIGRQGVFRRVRRGSSMSDEEWRKSRKRRVGHVAGFLGAPAGKRDER